LGSPDKKIKIKIKIERVRKKEKKSVQFGLLSFD
jgi:hypothetical protein